EPGIRHCHSEEGVTRSGNFKQGAKNLGVIMIVFIDDYLLLIGSLLAVVWGIARFLLVNQVLPRGATPDAAEERRLARVWLNQRGHHAYRSCRGSHGLDYRCRKSADGCYFNGGGHFSCSHYRDHPALRLQTIAWPDSKRYWY